MIEVKPLPDRPGPDVDADEWSVHHRVLYRLVIGAAGSHTADLQYLYDVLAPVAYHGTTSTAVSSRSHRRKLLRDLRDAELVTSHPTPRGWVWTPAEDVVDTDPNCPGAPRRGTRERGPTGG